MQLKRNWRQSSELLILLLVKVGATSQEIGRAIKVHHSRVRQLVPTGKVKKINFTGGVED